MTLYEFNALSTQEQFQTVWERGTFLRTRLEEGTVRILYALGDFWVETRYNPSENELMGLTAFRSTKRLEVFLEGLELPG